VDYLKIENSLSSFTKDLYQKLRAIVPVFEQDRIMAPEINKIRDYLLQNSFNI
jgi:histidine ammonia-lyase